MYSFDICYVCTGIINDTESLFDYSFNGPAVTWEDFYDPDFSPMLDITFSDPAIEKQAREICKDDPFCLYDIAATGDVAVGESTFVGSENLEMINEILKPGISDFLPSC